MPAAQLQAPGGFQPLPFSEQDVQKQRSSDSTLVHLLPFEWLAGHMRSTLRSAGLPCSPASLAAAVRRLVASLVSAPGKPKPPNHTRMHLSAIILDYSLAMLEPRQSIAQSPLKVAHMALALQECKQHLPPSATKHLQLTSDTSFIVSSIHDLFGPNNCHPVEFVVRILRFGWGEVLLLLLERLVGPQFARQIQINTACDMLRMAAQRSRQRLHKLRLVDAFAARTDARELVAKFRSGQQQSTNGDSKQKPEVQSNALCDSARGLQQAEAAPQDPVACKATHLVGHNTLSVGRVMQHTSNLLGKRATSAEHTADLAQMSVLEVARDGASQRLPTASLQCSSRPSALSSALELAISSMQGLDSGSFNLLPDAQSTAGRGAGESDSSSDGSTTTMSSAHDSNSDQRVSFAPDAIETPARAAWRELGYLESLPRARADSVLPAPVMRRTLVTNSSQSDSEHATDTIHAVKHEEAVDSSVRRLPPAIALLQRTLESGLLLQSAPPPHAHETHFDCEEGGQDQERSRADSLDELIQTWAGQRAADADGDSSRESTHSASSAGEMSIPSLHSTADDGHSDSSDVPFGSPLPTWQASPGSSPERTFLATNEHPSPNRAQDQHTFHEGTFKHLEQKVEVQRSVKRYDLVRASTLVSAAREQDEEHAGVVDSPQAPPRGFWTQPGNEMQVHDEKDKSAEEGASLRASLLAFASGLSKGSPPRAAPRGALLGSSPTRTEHTNQQIQQTHGQAPMSNPEHHSQHIGCDSPAPSPGAPAGNGQRVIVPTAGKAIAMTSTHHARKVLSPHRTPAKTDSIQPQQRASFEQTISPRSASSQATPPRGASPLLSAVPSPEAAFWADAQHRKTAQVKAKEVEARATAARVAIALVAHSLDTDAAHQAAGGDAPAPALDAGTATTGSTQSVKEARKMLFQATEAARNGAFDLCNLLEDRVPQLMHVWPLLLPDKPQSAACTPPSADNQTRIPAVIQKAIHDPTPKNDSSPRISSRLPTSRRLHHTRPVAAQTSAVWDGALRSKSSKSGNPEALHGRFGSPDKARKHPSSPTKPTGEVHHPPGGKAIQHTPEEEKHIQRQPRAASVPRGHFSAQRAPPPRRLPADEAAAVYDRLASTGTRASSNRRMLAQQRSEKRKQRAAQVDQPSQVPRSTSVAALQRLHAGMAANGRMGAQASRAAAQRPQAEKSADSSAANHSNSTSAGRSKARSPGQAAPHNAPPALAPGTHERQQRPPSMQRNTPTKSDLRKSGKPAASMSDAQKSPRSQLAASVRNQRTPPPPVEGGRQRTPPPPVEGDRQRTPPPPVEGDRQRTSVSAPGSEVLSAEGTTRIEPNPVGTTAVFEMSVGETGLLDGDIAPWMAETGAVGAVSYSPSGDSVQADDENDMAFLHSASESSWQERVPPATSPVQSPVAAAPDDSPPPLPREQLASASKRLDFLASRSTSPQAGDDSPLSPTRPRAASGLQVPPPPPPAAPAQATGPPPPAAPAPATRPLPDSIQSTGAPVSVLQAVQRITSNQQPLQSLGDRLSTVGKLPTQPRCVPDSTHSSPEPFEKVVSSRQPAQPDAGVSPHSISPQPTPSRSSPLKSVTSLLNEIRQGISVAQAAVQEEEALSDRHADRDAAESAAGGTAGSDTTSVPAAGPAREDAEQHAPIQGPASPTSGLAPVFRDSSLVWPPPFSSTPSAYVAKASKATSSYLYHRSTGFYYHPKKQLYVSPAGFAGQGRTYFRFDDRRGHFKQAAKRKQTSVSREGGTESERAAIAQDDAMARAHLVQRLQAMSNVNMSAAPAGHAREDVSHNPDADQDAGAAWLEQRRARRQHQLREVSSRVLAAAMHE